MAMSNKGHRFSPEIISYAVWLYHRFTLSFRDVEDLLTSEDCLRNFLLFWLELD